MVVPIIGSNASEQIYATPLADFIDGKGGNDTINADHGFMLGAPDIVRGGDGNDVIYVGFGPNAVYGDAGDDRLYLGNAPGEVAAGGTGNDTYYRVSPYGIIDERAGEGTDTIYLANSLLTHYSMPDFVENLYADSFFGVHANGNGLSNRIGGNTGDDVLHGDGGNDTLEGRDGWDELHGDSGNDQLHGGIDRDSLFGGDGDDALNGDDGDDSLQGDAGADTLTGGAGKDTMAGGSGNDLYRVDSSGDAVIESAGGGYDEVQTALASHTLAGQVEALTYTGAGKFAGTGNTLDNRITAGSGADSLHGGDGADSLYGNAGADSLQGQNGGDMLSGSTGNDVLFGGAGFDRLYGGDDQDMAWGGSDSDWLGGGNGNDTLYGESGTDTLRGDAGDDRLNGGTGIDQLAGGTGKDTFVFFALSESPDTERDTIQDFEKGLDLIHLGAIDARTNVAGDQAFTFSTTKPFFTSPGDLWTEAVASGVLVRGDVNGDGVADLGILVQGVTSLSASDFLL